MKKLPLLLFTLVLLGCQKSLSLNQPMSLEWVKYEPEISSEPNYHFMLKSKEQDLCIISLRKENTDKATKIKVKAPANQAADIDCYVSNKNYVLDDSGNTYFLSETAPTSEGKMQVSVQAKLSNPSTSKLLLIDQAIIITNQVNR